jgi:hypothetical protein
MSTTYKNTNNSLLFFTENNFLDAIDTIFQFRFVESKENKWVLEFRPVNELIWERKPISIELTTNRIEYNKDLDNYFITNNENNIEEDVHILKLYYTLHQLLVDAVNKPNLILPEHCISVSQIKVIVTYHFDNSKFPAWLKGPGQPTLRISNGGIKDNYATIYLAFNNWKYIQLLKREATNKKRKLEPEVTPESVPIDTKMPVSLNPLLPETQTIPVEVVMQP